MNSKPRPDGLHIDLAEFNRRVQILIEKGEKGQLSVDDLLRLKLDLNRMARGLWQTPTDSEAEQKRLLQVGYHLVLKPD